MAMELALELEDDLYFADLSRQISMLIMDDDDDDLVSACPSVAFQTLSRTSYYQAAQSPLSYEQNYTRESKGTGVFIPRSSQPRKRPSRKQARFNSLNTLSQQSQTQNHRHNHHRQYDQNPRRSASQKFQPTALH